MKKIAILLVLCISSAIGTASACTLGVGPDFPQLVKSERSVFVFEIESLEVQGQGPPYELASGRIRVLRTLKGPPAHFGSIRIPIGSCGLHMQVGDAYVVATSLDGKVLELFPRGHSVLALHLAYDPTAGNERNDRRWVLGEIRKILQGGESSADFPTGYDLAPFAPPSPPLPAPAAPPRKQR